MFRICSDWTELTFLEMIFRKKGYPEKFIGKCFKKLLDNIRHMDIQTVKFVQVIEYNKRTIFLQKSCRN